MSKKTIIIVVGLAVFAYVIYSYLARTETSLKKGLSSRSREFIKSQQEAGSADWKNIDVENADKASGAGGLQTVGSCFTFEMPFPITLQRENGKCNAWYSVDSPKGQVTAYMNEVELENLSEDSGVYMRRVNKDEYSERTKTFSGRQWLIFNKKEGAYEASAFNLTSGRELVINIVSTSNEDLDKELFSMLESVKVIK